MGTGGEHFYEALNPDYYDGLYGYGAAHPSTYTSFFNLSDKGIISAMKRATGRIRQFSDHLKGWFRGIEEDGVILLENEVGTLLEAMKGCAKCATVGDPNDPIDMQVAKARVHQMRTRGGSRGGRSKSERQTEARRENGRVGNQQKILREAIDGNFGTESNIFYGKCVFGGEGCGTQSYLKRRFGTNSSGSPYFSARCPCNGGAVHGKWIAEYKLPVGVAEKWQRHIVLEEEALCAVCKEETRVEFMNNYAEIDYYCSECEEELNTGNIFDDLVVNRCDCGQRHRLSNKSFEIGCDGDCKKWYIVANGCMTFPTPDEWFCSDCVDLNPNNV